VSFSNLICNLGYVFQHLLILLTFDAIFIFSNAVSTSMHFVVADLHAIATCECTIRLTGMEVC